MALLAADDQFGKLPASLSYHCNFASYDSSWKPLAIARYRASSTTRVVITALLSRKLKFLSIGLRRSWSKLLHLKGTEQFSTFKDRLFCCHFFSGFIFSVPSKVIITARAKMSLSRAQNMFMPRT